MNWKKILLVIQREYLTRVRTRIFVISTLLIPVGLIAYIGLIIGLQYWQSEPEQTIGILDRTEVLISNLSDINPDRYLDMSDHTPESLRQLVLQREIDGYIILEEAHIGGVSVPEFIYMGSGSITLLASIRSELREVIRNERLMRAGVSDELRTIFDSSVSLESRKLTASGTEEADQTAFYTVLGFVMGFLIFFALFMYGTIIMKGVIEEKSNRIVEIIASSIRPVDLLTGKILGITTVAVTQFGIWFLFTGLILVLTGPLMILLGGERLENPAVTDRAADAAGGFDLAAFEIPAVDPFLIAAFFLFFILGYFIYSSLFAMVGSTVDSEADTQQMMMPVMFLIVIAWVINIEVMQNPESTISVVSSLIPFFTPITMLTRIAISSVPVWQLLLSVVIMVVTIAATLWFSARIYRVGILQYGEKAGFRDLLKWLRQG